MIQYTDHCNARCPQCGMRIGNNFKRSRLEDHEIKKIIDAAANRGIRAVSFTGGEPLMFVDRLVSYIDYSSRCGLDYIRTGTNGFVFTNSEAPDFRGKVERLAEKLAATELRNFWISIDSAVPEVHEKMRGLPGVVKGIEIALPIFHRFGLYPSANLGINRNMGGDNMPFLSQGSGTLTRDYLEGLYSDFCQAFAHFYRRIIDLGFTMVNTCYPMSLGGDGLDAVYAATSADRIVRFADVEKGVLFRALFDTVPEFRSKIRIFSPLISLYALRKEYEGREGDSYACRGGTDFFFIDSRDGNTYPCGYRGRENLGKFWEMDDSGLDRQTACRRCDWECFRDPAELFGPILSGLRNPMDVLRKFRRDPRYARIWVNDLRYYRACGFFDSRRPPDYGRLSRFNKR